MNLLVGILTVIGLVFAGYSHLLSRTVIPSIESIVAETKSTFFAVAKFDLTEEGQIHLFEKFKEKNDDLDRMDEWLITLSSPLFAAVSYIPDRTQLNRTHENHLGSRIIRGHH